MFNYVSAVCSHLAKGDEIDDSLLQMSMAYGVHSKEDVLSLWSTLLCHWAAELDRYGRIGQCGGIDLASDRALSFSSLRLRG